MRAVMEDRDYAHELDRFLVEVFNDILKTEESYLSRTRSR